MDEHERVLELLDRGSAYERVHDLGPARRLLTQALDAASAAGIPTGRPSHARTLV